MNENLLPASMRHLREPMHDVFSDSCFPPEFPAVPGGGNAGKLAETTEKIIRIRAVQEVCDFQKRAVCSAKQIRCATEPELIQVVLRRHSPLGVKKFAK